MALLGMVASGSGCSTPIAPIGSSRSDRILTFDDALAAKPSARQLLWVDVEGELPAERRRALVERFGLDAAIDRALARTGDVPELQLHGKHFHLRVAAEPDAMRPEGVRWLDIVAGPNVVVSRHAERLEFLEAINERIASDATIGELDSAEFVASVLDAIVTTYHGGIDQLEEELDDIDAQALARPDAMALFGQLVGIRQRVGRLRRLLAAHRELFAALGRPDFARGIESADPEVFLAVTPRFESAILSLESTREAVLGSFDVLMTRASHRTNDVMRVLTVATVMALPATITAGLLGMNVTVPVPNDDPTSFWIIVAMVVAFEVAVFAIARSRHWI